MTRALRALAAGAAIALSFAAMGQQPDVGGEDFSGESPKMPTMPTRPSQPGKGTNEITLEVKSFGIGNFARPGEWTAVRVAVNDSAEKVRNVVVRASVLDPDGDTALMQRVIVTNPGLAQTVWLYLRLPFGAAGQPFETDITASEAIEAGSPGTGEAQQYLPGRLLGRQRLQVSGQNILEPYVGMLPVVGYGAGLEQYVWESDQTGKYSVTGHELTRVVTQISMALLPDRWHGYSGSSAFAWTSNASDDNPLNLRKDQADAISEWVRRGGHMLIVLPTTGQNWVGQPTNPLSEIVPAAKITRTEGVKMSRYAGLITSDKKVDLNDHVTIVQSFTPAIGSSWPSDTFPIMVGPDGEVVVLRRVVGQGMVTVVGLDVASPKLHKITHGFMADQFWNRILGKRLRTLTLAEINAGDKFKPFPGEAEDAEPQSYSYSVGFKDADFGIGKAVNDEGNAAVGLMTAFFVFAAYWLIAGPIGYFLLKQKNWKQHAWVAFLAATGVFTVVSWTGANLLKPLRVKGYHLTILDGVYGQNTQRARSWIGMFLPSYGTQEVSVAPAPGTIAPGGVVGAEWHNLVATLDMPNPAASTSWSTFPDARGYSVEARKPDVTAFPSRATQKQVQVDWAGSLPDGWGMPHPIADASVPVGQEIRLVERKDDKGNFRDWAIQGTLVHNLPSALKNVVVTVVREPLTTDPAIPGERIRRAIWMGSSGTNEWAPGTPLDLAVFLDKMGKDNKLEKDCLARDGGFATGALDDGMPPSEFAFVTAFLDMYRPPDAIRGKGREFNKRYVYRRYATHGFDLSRWFTQPSVIVVGELGEKDSGVECPVPIRVAGDDVRKRLKGKTIVRWVFPLEAMPFATAPKVLESATSDVPSGSAGGAKIGTDGVGNMGTGAGAP